MGIEALTILQHAQSGSFHFGAVSKRVDSQIALSWLVRQGYLDAYGSKKWEEARFSITSKGRDQLIKELNHEQ